MNNLVSLNCCLNQKGGSDLQIPMINQSGLNCYFRNTLMFLLKLFDNTNTLEECKRVIEDNTLDDFANLEKIPNVSDEKISQPNKIKSIKLIFKILEYMSNNRNNNINNQTIIYKDATNKNVNFREIYQWLYQGGIVGTIGGSEEQLDPASILENLEDLYEVMVTNIPLCNTNSYSINTNQIYYYQDDGELNDSNISSFKTNVSNYKVLNKINNEKEKIIVLNAQQFLLNNNNDLQTVLDNLYDKREHEFQLGSEIFDFSFINKKIRIDSCNDIIKEFLNEKIADNIKIQFWYKDSVDSSRQIDVSIEKESNIYFFNKISSTYKYYNNKEKKDETKNWDDIDISIISKIDISDSEFPRKKAITKTEYILSPLVSNIIIQLQRFYTTDTKFDHTGFTPGIEKKTQSEHYINEFINIDGNILECQAIICHEGTSIKRGHYRQYIKEGSQWKYYIDNTITDISFDQVNYNGSEAAINGYIFLYKKNTIVDIIKKCNN